MGNSLRVVSVLVNSNTKGILQSYFLRRRSTFEAPDHSHAGVCRLAVRANFEIKSSQHTRTHQRHRQRRLVTQYMCTTHKFVSSLDCCCSFGRGGRHVRTVSKNWWSLSDVLAEYQEQNKITSLLQMLQQLPFENLHSLNLDVMTRGIDAWHFPVPLTAHE